MVIDEWPDAVNSFKLHGIHEEYTSDPTSSYWIDPIDYKEKTNTKGVHNRIHVFKLVRAGTVSV